MKKAKQLMLMGATCMVALIALWSCETNDVTAEVVEEPNNRYELTDQAFIDYLIFNSNLTSGDNMLPADIVVLEDGKYYLDTDKAATVTNLYLVKNDTQITKLTEGGVATAAQLITNLDGLQYFTALQTLKLTSNAITQMDLTKCHALETLEMNNNCMTELDLSGCYNLSRFRCGSSSSADVSTKISAIDFTACTKIQHIYMRYQNVQTGAFILPAEAPLLTEIDMRNNPGASFAIPASIYNQLTTKQGVKSE